MARKFRSKIRLKVGGVIDPATGEMTGGVTIGHFAASHNADVSRPILESAIANGPTVRQVDPEGDTCDITIEAEQNSVEARNLGHYWVDGGDVALLSSDALDQKILARYGVFQMGNFGQSGSKEAAKETATLVGTNSIREAAWIDDQPDMPDADAPAGGGA